MEPGWKPDSYTGNLIQIQKICRAGVQGVKLCLSFEKEDEAEKAYFKKKHNRFEEPRSFCVQFIIGGGGLFQIKVFFGKR